MVVVVPTIHNIAVILPSRSLSLNSIVVFDVKSISNARRNKKDKKEIDMEEGVDLVDCFL